METVSLSHGAGTDRWTEKEGVSPTLAGLSISACVLTVYFSQAPPLGLPDVLHADAQGAAERRQRLTAVTTTGLLTHMVICRVFHGDDYDSWKGGRRREHNDDEEGGYNGHTLPPVPRSARPQQRPRQ